MRTLVDNPAWVTKAIGSSFETMELRVPPKWLPMIVKTGSYKGRLVGAIKEYGCGVYGCVVPTLDPAVVLKVTTDPTEAQFATEMSRGIAVPIVVHYHMVMQLAQKRQGNTIFLLWRESAQDVGGYESELLDGQHRCAEAAYIEMRKTGTTTQKAIRAWRRAVEAMAADPELEYLAHGMLRVYDEQGIFFGDVHAGNIGRAKRGDRLEWVIIDPGHVSVVKR